MRNESQKHGDGASERAIQSVILCTLQHHMYSKVYHNIDISVSLPTRDPLAFGLTSIAVATVFVVSIAVTSVFPDETVAPVFVNATLLNSCRSRLSLHVERTRCTKHNKSHVQKQYSRTTENHRIENS